MIVSNNEHSNYSDNKEITLKVENLSKVYVSAMGRVVSLRNVSFSVSRGEFVSVVGPSGSGKSTLLNMIGALD
ncbi:MAG: ATP-binding cassette domain-containing protein, partial [Candidatus Nitrosopolaris sp.]